MHTTPTHNKIGQTTTHDSRKNKTNPFIYNKSHPINDSTKNLFLENTKITILLRNTNKNHFLDKMNGRKKPI